MDKKRVLIVTQEMKPYLAVSKIAQITRDLPQYIQEQGMEIRVLMPRFGNINERRNRLHEVVRLSGINIMIKDDDYPLIIKVASLPGARIQVYFLDNEDLYHRKAVFRDSNSEFFEDNDDRMVFFCKGVLETVKKFGWAPDIIHCHGWLTSLIPLYVKNSYKNDPIFKGSKVVYSVYEEGFEEKLGKKFAEKIPINNSISEEDLKLFNDGDHKDLILGAVKYSDAIIKNGSYLEKEISKQIDNKTPVLDFKEDDEIMESCHELYKKLLDA